MERSVEPILETRAGGELRMTWNELKKLFNKGFISEVITLHISEIVLVALLWYSVLNGEDPILLPVFVTIMMIAVGYFR